MTTSPTYRPSSVKPVCLSIVSHGQGQLIRPLLVDIAAGAVQAAEIILTINIPEDEAFLADFSKLPLLIIRNTSPKGFGANHNAAFHASKAECFVVVNPDIRLRSFDITPLLEALTDPSVGIAAPVVYSSDGQLQDSARHFPTVVGLIRRKLHGLQGPDYIFGDSPVSVDWVAGMFMVMRRASFQAVGGFDDRYFMYFEDVDFCRRLKARGLSVKVVPSVRVIHDAQRASRRKLRHFLWHLSGAFRFLAGG